MTPDRISQKNSLSVYISAGLATIIIILSYFVFKTPGSADQSLFQWISLYWFGSGAGDGQQSWIVIPLIAFLLYQAKDELIIAPKQIDWRGLVVLAIGIFIYYIGYRSYQCRITIASLPFISVGACWYLWGSRVAKLVAFPLFLFLLSIPIPGFQQATVGLQIVATQMACTATNLLGIETYVQGTNILPKNGDWDTISIAGGCSGIRSLTSLILFSATWAYLTPMAFWKRVVLFLSAFPIAIIGNGFRIISIFVFAEYVNPEFAVNTWHDWSTFVLFFPISLICLMGVQLCLTGKAPWKRKPKTVVIKNNQPIHSDSNA